jgi:hypothetical protein
MIQHLEKDLKKFHELFQGGRCQAWQLEELIAKAIRSDFDKNEKVLWKGNGHDIGCDIIVNDDVKIQIKSGTIKKDSLVLSGHRLGRFKGDLEVITDFLNDNQYLLVAVPYYSEEDDNGKSHIYQIFYLETKMLGLEDYKKWKKEKSKYVAVNKYGVELSINPSMSWQIWWNFPLSEIPESNKTRKITIK